MLGSNCSLDLIPRSTLILFLLCSLSLTNFIENELFLTTSFSLLFSLSGVVVPSEPLPEVLFPPSGVWVIPSVTEPPASGLGLVPWLVFPFSILPLSLSISVVLVWADSPCVLPSCDWLGSCVLSDVLPLVVP